MSSRMAGALLSDDQVIDALIELEEAFKGFGKLYEVEPQGYTQKLIDAVQSFNEADQRLIDAGVKPSAMQGLKALDTGVLRGDVPGPYIKEKKGIETRVFMDWTINPVTGQRELKPFIAAGEDVPLTHTYGTTERRPGHSWQRADEETAEVIMKLRGLEAQSRDHGGRGLSDLVVRKGNQVRNVDVMMGPAHKMGTNKPSQTRLIPAFTALQPIGPYKGRITDEVKRLVEAETRRTGGNVIKAVDNLTSSGRLGVPSEEQRVGKIMRSDRRRVNSDAEQYHGLIIPGFSDEIMERGIADKVTVPPLTIHSADLGLVRNDVQAGVLNNRRYSPNRGAHGTGNLRTQLKIAVPLNHTGPDGRKLLTDVTVAHPMTQQALDTSAMQYIRKPTRR